MNPLPSTTSRHVRRIAVNYLWIDGKCYLNHVIVLDGDHMVCHYPLEGEPAMTEWMGGALEVVDGRIHPPFSHHL